MTALDAYVLGFAFSFGVGVTLWAQGRLSFYAAASAAVAWPLTWAVVGGVVACLGAVTTAARGPLCAERDGLFSGIECEPVDADDPNAQRRLRVEPRDHRRAAHGAAE